MANEIPDISPDMERLYRRFERWRSAHTGRLPIPERLWTAAAELAREHGVFPTAKALRLEYGKLKQQAELLGPTAKRRSAKVRTRVRGHVPPAPSPPSFVELMAPRSGSLPSAVVELEHAIGGRNRSLVCLRPHRRAEATPVCRQRQRRHFWRQERGEQPRCPAIVRPKRFGHASA